MSAIQKLSSHNFFAITFIIAYFLRTLFNASGSLQHQNKGKLRTYINYANLRRLKINPLHYTNNDHTQQNDVKRYNSAYSDYFQI